MNLKGIINVGGKAQSVYDFVKVDNPKIKKKYYSKKIKPKMALNSTMSIIKLNKILKS